MRDFVKQNMNANAQLEKKYGIYDTMKKSVIMINIIDYQLKTSYH